jgi:hypothetical protein
LLFHPLSLLINLSPPGKTLSSNVYLETSYTPFQPLLGSSIIFDGTTQKGTISSILSSIGLSPKG